MVKTIGNPLSWGAEAVGAASSHIAETTGRIGGEHLAPPEIQKLKLSDLKVSLQQGFDDFVALRTDVIFMAALYPLIGLCLTVFAFNATLAPSLFPLASGFALIGPVAAIGLYELSRRREAGLSANWGDAFALLRSPSLGPIVVMGFYLLMIFVLWMVVANQIYNFTLGPEAPVSIGAFLTDVFTTGAGWAMIIIGCAVGLVFAAIVLAISVVSFPLLLDRQQIGVPAAVVTSIEVARKNPVVISAWGLIVAVTLMIGTIPLFLGLIVALPVLGHATWHLYRKAVKPVDTTGTETEGPIAEMA